jgi:hypothetical protein
MDVLPLAIAVILPSLIVATPGLELVHVAVSVTTTGFPVVYTACSEMF